MTCGEFVGWVSRAKTRAPPISSASSSPTAGACWHIATGSPSVPALRCERVDESGAGDAFTAAFAVALLERRPVRTCRVLRGGGGANLHEQAGRAGVLPWPHRYRCTAPSAARMRERTAAGLTGSDATILTRRS